MKRCLNCDSVGDVQMHHIIPKSRGGDRMIPLCDSCHSVIHGITPNSGGLTVSNSELIKRAWDNRFLFEYLIIARLFVKGRGDVDHTHAVIRRVYKMNGIGHYRYSLASHKKRYARFFMLARTDREYLLHVLFKQDIGMAGIDKYRGL